MTIPGSTGGTGGGSTSWEGGGSTSWDTPSSGGGPQPPRFDLDPDIRNFLMGLDFQILAWHLDIGSWILKPIDWVLNVINLAYEWIAQLVAWWEEFRQEVLDFVNLVPVWIGEVWNWITNLGQMIGQWIADWWDGVQDTVHGWIDAAIAVVTDWVKDLAGNIAGLAALVGDFFSSILPSLARLIDVQDIVMGILGPFRWIFNFMEEFREEITAFFSDPLQWVYDKLDEFFDRFW